MVRHKPDKVLINGTTIITGHLYPLRAEDAFYDTDRTVMNPTEFLTEKENLSLLDVGNELLHTHNNGVELSPKPLYFVASLPRNWQAGGPVKRTDCVTVLLSENRQSN